MRIDIEKNLVEFHPESSEEKAKLETLWRILIDCVNTTRKMVPVGEYVPERGKTAATFYIEGLAGNEQAYVNVHADRDCIVWCDICNKQVNLKKGDPIPVCCGKVMEIVD